MAPEQQSNPAKATHLSDIYSLGVLMHELFTSKSPAQLNRRPIDLVPSIPPKLNELIERCICKDGEQRPQTVASIRDALLALSRGSHIKDSQRQRASSGTKAAKRELLDVISENKNGAAYLYQDLSSKQLVIVSKRPIKSGGVREARLLQSFEHQGIAKILEIAEDERDFYITSEYLAGNRLDSRLAKPTPLREFTGLALQICEALKFAHKHRVVHGNLRPANIFFDDEERIKISDFGFSNTAKDWSSDWYSPPDLESRTVALDVFSLGAIFYHMLVGVPIRWSRGELNHSMAFYLLPELLRDLLTKMLYTHENGRHKSMAEVIAEISAISPAVVQAKDDAKSRLMTSIQKPPKRLVSQSQLERFDFPYKTVSFVCLSMGGLIALYYFAPTQYQQLAHYGDLALHASAEALAPYEKQLAPFWTFINAMLDDMRRWI